jgi:flagellar M-ring protein FliF
VRAQVTAVVDYNHINETSETFDPDSKVLRSTTTSEKKSTDSNGGGAQVSVANALPGQQQQAGGGEKTKSDSGQTEEINNYEISKTVKTSSVDQGTIKKVSIAVVVDGTDKDSKYVARSAEEMKQIEGLVKSAIGFDAARGDLVQVVNMPFARVDVTAGTPAPQPMLGLDGPAWFKIIEAAIFSLTSLLIGIFVLRPLTKRMFAPLSGTITTITSSGTPASAQLAAPAGRGEGDAEDATPARAEAMIDISRIEGQVRESSVKKVGEVVNAHPEEALAILRSWLHQPV